LLNTVIVTIALRGGLYDSPLELIVVIGAISGAVEYALIGVESISTSRTLPCWRTSMRAATVAVGVIDTPEVGTPSAGKFAVGSAGLGGTVCP
jgi:hypothetical protein